MSDRCVNCGQLFLFDPKTLCHVTEGKHSEEWRPCVLASDRRSIADNERCTIESVPLSPEVQKRVTQILHDRGFKGY